MALSLAPSLFNTSPFVSQNSLKQAARVPPWRHRVPRPFRCLSKMPGKLRWAGVEERKEVADRLSSVIMNAGRSKKRIKDNAGPTRLEGSRRIRKDGRSGSRDPRTQTKTPDKSEDSAEDPEKDFEGTPVGTLPRKPKSGPKPRERVTQAGRPMVLVNKGERYVGDATPWTSDPTDRRPDDYYEYGPFGPHAWKGVVVGSPRWGTFADNPVVFFSSVRNEDHEKMAIDDSIMNFNRIVEGMDESVGIQYYFAFVRQVQKLPCQQPPWQEWTLVSQIAIESKAELDKWRLGFMLDGKSRQSLTRCVSWFRPDLVYIKRPAYQVRFEPQKKFLESLLMILNPDTEDKSAPYFGKLCKLLGVHEKNDEQQVGSTFDGLTESKKTECLGHVIGSHPVELLTPFNRKARDEDLIGKAEGGTNTHASQGIDGNYEDESDEDEEASAWPEDGSLENVHDEGDYGSEFDMDEIPVDFEENFDLGEQSNDGEWKGTEWELEEARALAAEAAQDHENEKAFDDDDEYLNEQVIQAYSEMDSNDFEGQRTAEDIEEQSRVLLKAAVRPYTYTNLIKEIFIIRKVLVEYPELR